jgi:hypothetical protein
MIKGSILYYLYYVLFVCFFQLSIELKGQIIDSNYAKIVVDCKIIRIDSIGGYYLFFTEEKFTKNRYKIVSEKDSLFCNNISFSISYKLTLHGTGILTMGCNIACVFPDGTSIFLNNWGNDLYCAEEIQGLCYNIDYAKLFGLKTTISYSYADSIQKVFEKMSDKKYKRCLKRRGFSWKGTNDMNPREYRRYLKKRQKNFKPIIPTYIENDDWIRKKG